MKPKGMTDKESAANAVILDEPTVVDVPAPWPIIASVDVILDVATRQRIEQLASRALAEDPLLDPASFAGAGVCTGWAPYPTLYMEDHRPIELSTEKAAQQFEYRSLGLASDGDFLLLARERDLHFEEHLRNDIGLGSPSILSLGQGVEESGSMCKACLSHKPVMATLVKAAHDAGGMNIIPFQSTLHTWMLARTIANKAEVPVWVAGPVPRLSVCSNNKLWFAQHAAQLLGTAALPPTWSACSYAMGAAHLKRIAQEHDTVAVKLPSSAGSMGNLLFDGRILRHQSLASIRDYLLQKLHQIAWTGGYPLLLSPWEAPVIASPSVQVWIPSMSDGRPTIEGLYSQILTGSTGKFTGAVQADLPPPLYTRMTEQAMQLAMLLQALGYFGRISMDALLIGDAIETATLHWIESNARWGGVSIPMTIVNRLGANPPNHHSTIVQARVAESLRSMTALHEASHACRYDRDTKQGVIWYNAPSINRASVFFIALAKSAQGTLELVRTMERALRTSFL